MFRNHAKKIYNQVLSVLPDRLAVQLAYVRVFHTLPRLQRPQTLTEKVAWRKLRQRDSRFTLFADKIAVKDEVAALIGKEHIIETLWTGKWPEDIPYDQLVPPYVIKVSHSSGGNIFIRTKEDVDQKKIHDSLHTQLNHAHGNYYREWGYSKIPRAILIERMIEMPDGSVPEDYKFFVYHGKAHFIQVDHGRFTDHTRTYFDAAWIKVPVQVIYPNAPHALEKPQDLEQMVAIAEKIGAQFDFVRVDLYSTPSGIKFGETTFYPGAGSEPFTPKAWNEKFGAPWKIKSY